MPRPSEKEQANGGHKIMKFMKGLAVGVLLIAANTNADTLIHAGRLIDG